MTKTTHCKTCSIDLETTNRHPNYSGHCRSCGVIKKRLWTRVYKQRPEVKQRRREEKRRYRAKKKNLLKCYTKSRLLPQVSTLDKAPTLKLKKQKKRKRIKRIASLESNLKARLRDHFKRNNGSI